MIKQTSHELGQNPVLVGDPGCLVKAWDLLDAKYAIGSAAAVVQGLARAGLAERPIALFGDSDNTAFFMMDEDRAGFLVEFGATNRIFTNPQDPRTEDYITGRFG